MSAIRFLTSPAPATLTGVVREFWLLDDDGRSSAGLPKPYVELVVSLSGVHWWRPALGGAEHRYVDAWVTPIQHGPRYARAVGRRRLIGARLEPWAAMALFGALPRGDGSPPPRLRQLIGAEAQRLRARLVAAHDDIGRFAELASWLEAQVALRGLSGGGIDRPEGAASVDTLARAMKLAPRSLRRRFASDLGLSPKQWLKLHRLDGVLRDADLKDASRPLTGIAHAHGYADQAHFSREIAGFTGMTPGRLRRRPEQSPPHYVPQG